MSVLVPESLNHAALSECFFPADRLFRADIALVLGMNDWLRPCDRAVELYKSSLVKTLAFAGGFNPNIAKTEASEMARRARQSGVPEQDILVETRSANTDQNFFYAKEAIASRFGANAIRSIIVVTIHYHLRRSLIAAAKHFADDVAIGWACYPSRHYSTADWHSTPRGRSDVAAELAKIEKYYSISLRDLVRKSP